jgi:glycerate 2-kinase
MARAFLEIAPRAPRAGMIACPPPSHDFRSPLEWFDASHPSPNQASVAAAERALAIAGDARAANGVLLVLLSGGASAMLTAPVDGVSLSDKIATARGLMHAGVAIGELNCVRKHLSRIKGGQLAAAALRTVTLSISDVHTPIADDPSVIGSGPTVADPTTFAQAIAITSQVQTLPASVRRYLELGAAGGAPETVKPGDPRLNDAVYEVIGNRLTAMHGARMAAESFGYDVVMIEEPTSGEARDAAAMFVRRAADLAARASGPLCVLAAGETTVTVTGQGLGGRNQEFALASSPAMSRIGDDVVLASVGTDGADGPTDAAGAVVDPTTLERAAQAGLDWKAFLADNDAYRFFAPLDDLVRWGATGTNVGDLQLFLRA